MEDSNVTPTMLKATLEGRGIYAGTPSAIVASEKAGKVEMQKGIVLPIKWSGGRSQPGKRGRHRLRGE